MNENNMSIQPPLASGSDLEKLPDDNKPSKLRRKLLLLFGGRPGTNMDFVGFLTVFLALGCGALAFFRLDFSLGTALFTAALTFVLLNVALLNQRTSYLAAVFGVSLAGLILGLLGYGIGGAFGSVVGALAGIAVAAASYYKIIQALNKIDEEKS